MTEITINRKGNIVSGIEVSGHSGYDEEGSDIVCAALSTLMQTLDIGLDQVTGVGSFSTERNDVRGYMACRWDPLDPSYQAGGQTLVHSVVLAMKAIAGTYPGNVHISEVDASDLL